MKQQMIRILGALVLIFIFAVPTLAGPKQENAALSAAQVFLNMVDEGNYAASWDAAASYFKANVKKDEWVKQLGASRPPLGAVLERKVVATKATKSLPGAPDGDYVVIQFATSFKNKKQSVETVTPMRDKDGKWRVSGYYIR